MLLVFFYNVYACFSDFLSIPNAFITVVYGTTYHYLALNVAQRTILQFLFFK